MTSNDDIVRIVNNEVKKLLFGSRTFKDNLLQATSIACQQALSQNDQTYKDTFFSMLESLHVQQFGSFIESISAELEHYASEKALETIGEIKKYDLEKGSELDDIFAGYANYPEAANIVGAQRTGAFARLLLRCDQNTKTVVGDYGKLLIKSEGMPRILFLDESNDDSLPSNDGDIIYICFDARATSTYAADSNVNTTLFFNIVNNSNKDIIIFPRMFIEGKNLGYRPQLVYDVKDLSIKANTKNKTMIGIKWPLTGYNNNNYFALEMFVVSG